MLCGQKKGRGFYSLGVYSDTATIPAILLLPAWLANECRPLFFSGVSHAAHAAHIGGPVGGAQSAAGGERLVGR